MQSGCNTTVLLMLNFYLTQLMTAQLSKLTLADLASLYIQHHRGFWSGWAGWAIDSFIFQEYEYRNRQSFTICPSIIWRLHIKDRSYETKIYLYERSLNSSWTWLDQNAVLCEMGCFLYMFSLFSTILIKSWPSRKLL